MNVETAQMVLVAITALAALVWLTGLQFLISSARKEQRREPLDSTGSEAVGPSEGSLLTGAVEIDGQPALLASKAASLLARSGLFPGVPVKILEKSDGHVRFEQVDPYAHGQAAGRGLRGGQFSFLPLGGGRTRVEWVVELAAMRWLLRLGAVFQVAGLLAIIAGCWAILTFIVPSPNPAIRWQVVQMVQVVHLLWPPFLFGALYRRTRRLVAARLDALAHNLPFLGDEG
jgi:hypothetical protein